MIIIYERLKLNTRFRPSETRYKTQKTKEEEDNHFRILELNNK